jgi:hypothetical protein
LFFFSFYKENDVALVAYQNYLSLENDSPSSEDEEKPKKRKDSKTRSGRSKSDAVIEERDKKDKKSKKLSKKSSRFLFYIHIFKYKVIGLLQRLLIKQKVRKLHHLVHIEKKLLKNQKLQVF